MTQLAEDGRIPIGMILTPKPLILGDEVKRWAIVNRDWFDITNDLVTPELLDEIDSLGDQILAVEDGLTVVEDQVFDILGDYLTRTTDETATGVKTWTKPQKFDFSAPSSDGSAGSATSWLDGFSYSIVVSGGIALGYPTASGVAFYIKGGQSRIANFYLNPDGEFYFRALHNTLAHTWKKIVHFPTSDGKIYGLKDGGFSESQPIIIGTKTNGYVAKIVGGVETWAPESTSGGDVTQAGDNAFTGSNSFASPPTSASDATSPNELVRFGQVIKQSISDYSPDIVASSSNPSVTTTSTSGWYCRTGSLITVYADIAWSAFSGGSGIVQVTLPTLIGTEVYGEKSVGNCRLSGFTYPSSGTQISTELNFDNTKLNIVSNSSGGSFENVEVSDVIAGSGRIQLEIQLLIIEAA